jgi:thioredoxin 1
MADNAENIMELTDSNFEEKVLNADKPVLVDFWAEWCGPCLAIAPVIEELAKEYNGKFYFGKLNVDNNSDSAIKYGIRSIPAIYFFNGGEVADKQIGNAPKSVLKDKIEAQLEKA